MANVTSVGDAVFVLRTQLAAASFPSNVAKEAARGLAERFTQSLVSVCGLNVTNLGPAPAASSLGDALGAQRVQLAAATYASNYQRQVAICGHDQLVAALLSLGAPTT